MQFLFREHEVMREVVLSIFCVAALYGVIFPESKITRRVSAVVGLLLLTSIGSLKDPGVLIKAVIIITVLILTEAMHFYEDWRDSEDFPNFDDDDFDDDDFYEYYLEDLQPQDCNNASGTKVPKKNRKGQIFTVYIIKEPDVKENKSSYEEKEESET